MVDGESDQQRLERLRTEVEDAPTIPEAEYRGVSRRAFLTSAGVVAAGIYGLYALQTGPETLNAPTLTREFHRLNESIWSSTFRDGHLAPTFSASESSILRVNGRIGLDEDIDVSGWEFTVEGPDGAVLGTHTLDDIKSLPKYEMIIEHKCVEGWSQVTTWAGARFSDFQALYPDQSDTEWVGMETPDGEYYVGNDRATMNHPQTLLVYEMVGEPLDQDHGAPLRLATPLKYGIKQLKRIAVIRFTNDQPDDYWAERGYDYYSAL